MKKITKKTTAMFATLIMTCSIGMPAFAADNDVKGEQINTPFLVTSAESMKAEQEASTRATTPIIDTVWGGTGEWGYGAFNAWCKYWNTTYEHAAVLQIDSNTHIGPYEDAGSTPSYIEHKKGNTIIGYGTCK